MIKVICFILIFTSCLGLTFSFSRTFDVFDEYLGTLTSAVDTVKVMIGEDRFSGPSNSKSTLGLTENGETYLTRIINHYNYLYRESELPFTKNLTVDKILALNPEVYYVTIGDFTYSAIRMTINVNTFFWWNPLDDADIIKTDVLWIEPYFPLSDNSNLDDGCYSYSSFYECYTSFYYLKDSTSIYPIFDFNYFTDTWIPLDIFNYTVYSIDNIKVNDIFPLKSMMGLIGMYGG